MSVNPYESRTLTVGAVPQQDWDRHRRARRVVIACSLTCCCLGIIWSRVMRANPASVSREMWVAAQLVTFIGMSIFIVIIAAQLIMALNRWCVRMGDGKETVVGWNLVPAAICLLISLPWFALALLGLHTMLREILNFDLERSIPISELVYQSLLYCAALIAGLYCCAGALHWLRRNRRRACVYAAVGLIIPFLASILLFRLLGPLVGFLSRPWM